LAVGAVVGGFACGGVFLSPYGSFWGARFGGPFGCSWYPGFGLWYHPWGWWCHPGLGFWMFPHDVYPYWYWPTFGYSVYYPVRDYPAVVIENELEDDLYCGVYYRRNGRLVMYQEPRFVSDRVIKLYVPSREDNAERVVVLSRNKADLIDELPDEVQDGETISRIQLEEAKGKAGDVRVEKIDDKDREYMSNAKKASNEHRDKLGDVSQKLSDVDVESLKKDEKTSDKN
jgi:hypothetical protein